MHVLVSRPVRRALASAGRGQLWGQPGLPLLCSPQSPLTCAFPPATEPPRDSNSSSAFF